MTKQIRAYLKALEEFFSAERSEAELLKMKSELLQRIAFYQHERLIHLLVTLGFAVFLLMSIIMVMITGEISILLLIALIFVLLAAYIKHYFFLENSVQRMYTYYFKVEKL